MRKLSPKLPAYLSSVGDAVVSAISVSDSVVRMAALVSLTQHESFRLANPQGDQCVLVYVEVSTYYLVCMDVRRLHSVYRNKL